MLVETVPTACGIETEYDTEDGCTFAEVATVPTACGIETSVFSMIIRTSFIFSCNSAYRLRY